MKASTPPTPGGKRPALEAAKLGEDVKGKVFVITGCYSGIGLETAKALLAVGGKVVIGGRNKELLKSFTNEMIRCYAKEQVDNCVIDLGDLESVQKFSKYVLDRGYKDICLICNAGVMNTPKGTTKSGFETQMGVNVVGHFLLAKMLAHITERQIWVSSITHKMNGSPRIDIDLIKRYQAGNFKGYDGWAAYQQSKLGNILLSKEFAKRYDNIKSISVHPGAIKTKILRHTGCCGTVAFVCTKLCELTQKNTGRMSMKTADIGASTTVTCATLPAEELVNGGYYEDCDITTESESAKNEEDSRDLFDFCDTVTKPFQ